MFFLTNKDDLLPFYAELLPELLLSHAVLSHALKSKAGLDQSSQRCNMSALCMNHVNLLWWAVLCAKCKLCFLPSPGVSESPDTRQPQLSWWYRPIQWGSSWLSTLGIPHPSPPSPRLLNPPKSLTGASSSLWQSCREQPFCLPPRPCPSQLLSASSSLSEPQSHYTEEPFTGALSRSFISVIASQQVCGSPS